MSQPYEANNQLTKDIDGTKLLWDLIQERCDLSFVGHVALDCCDLASMLHARCLVGIGRGLCNSVKVLETTSKQDEVAASLYKSV